MSTSIDKEIGEIQVALRNTHEAIYKLALQMNNATSIVDAKLSKVDVEVRKVAREVTHIRDNTNTVTSLVGFITLKQSCRDEICMLISTRHELGGNQKVIFTSQFFSSPPTRATWVLCWLLTR